MGITYRHQYTVLHDFDPDNITETFSREVMKRHYDFLKWCENNTTSPYSLDRKYNRDGIRISFKSEEDFQLFFNFLGTYYGLFLHN